jgi:purine catabolism regulator
LRSKGRRFQLLQLIPWIGERLVKSSDDYVIRDLLNEPDLRLELLTGGSEALSVPLVGAHAIELDRPSKWLDAGWMMLTMGVRLRNKPQAQRDLIAELQELGASCLGFGVGLSFKTVPPALLDEAKRRNFPVVLVPEDSQFRDVTRAVFHSTVGIESMTFRRLSSIQQNVTRAFADEKPLESIVQRLARLVHSTVAVISLEHEVDAATGTLPLAEIVAGLTGKDFPLVELEIADWEILAAPVSESRTLSARWLVVATRKPTAAPPGLIRAAVQATVPLIDALLRMSTTKRAQDRAIQQTLLDSVLDDKSAALDVGGLESQLSAAGIKFNSDMHVLVIQNRSSVSPHGVPSTMLDGVRAWAHSLLDDHSAQYLLSRRGEEIVLLADLELVEEVMSQELLQRWPTLVVGVGRAVKAVRDIPISHRDAQITVRYLDGQAEPGILCFDKLDVVTQLLAEVPLERLEVTAGPIAAVLRENPIQLEALRAYFANDRDIQAAADSIFLHPNTLRYRLERLEHKLGRSLREPSVTASLYCVLTLLEDFTALSQDGGKPAVAL